ncbi:B3 domain-containing protein Os06g0194400-like isoform X3 [Punica granatum]|uniref:B3 domain-containing protein Os06g0194400-like isoform X3 n=1 Tax=Punica granatum TaxID=22663 RepID=A0A6P8CU54_PUNGR|nr:B3 domain-containing protein Os06g0194400-like isoform X3 [Punica granatum]
MAGAGSKRNYEELRRQRMEENKKRMEELNLSKLASALAASPKESTSVKESKPRGIRKQSEPSSAPARRSSRVANLPPRSYKEVLELDPSVRVRGHSRRDLSDRIYASDEIRQYAVDRAGQLETRLGATFPSFVKPMLQSHVTGGFWLGLPNKFCKKHLPHRDETVTLVDENGTEHPTKYLAEKNGLSGGWRGFAIDHELVDGDALVFRLIKPTVFKILHIFVGSETIATYVLIFSYIQSYWHERLLLLCSNKTTYFTLLAVRVSVQWGFCVFITVYNYVCSGIHYQGICI